MSLTSTVVTEQHGTLTVPKDPYKFAKDIQYSQPSSTGFWRTKHKILFNKGRYFETSFGGYESEAKVLEQLCALTGFIPQFTNMIVQSWKDLEDFVIAMNIIGIYVEIEVDWI